MIPRRFSSIKAKIFTYYGIVFLILMLLIVSLYYYTAYNTFLSNYTNTSAQLSKIISNEITNYFDDINAIQKKLLESDSIREYIFNEAKERNAVKDRNFTNMIYSIVGYDFEFYHINILNLEDDTLLTFGQKYGYETYHPSTDTKRQIIDPILDRKGNKFITPTNSGTIYEVTPDVKTLSYSRAFSRYFLTPPKGILEIQISYGMLESLVDKSLLSFQGTPDSVVIFDKDHNLIYPLDLSADLTKFYTSIDTSSQTMFKNPVTGEKEIVTAQYSEDTGFTTVVITPDSTIAGNRIFFRNISISIALAGLLILLAITYKIAKSISSPIIELRDSLVNLKLDAISPEVELLHNNGLNELEMLNEAYHHMQLRLKSSLDDIVRSRSLNIHAQLMALQAQMDSHFLYNTLTIISIIAEESEDYQAASMCIKLTQMLRYITKDVTASTTLRDEIDHTKNYADLMKSRFGDKIEFIYETDQQLAQTQIPRLVIQPLFENSVKYSRVENKVLIIQLTVCQKDDYWYVKVQDNGPGFTKQALDDINSKIEQLDNSSDYQHLDLSGMGLANIYLRLKFYYPSDFIFHIENIDGGSVITIGGMIHEHTE